MSKHSVAPSEVSGLLCRFTELRRKAAARTGQDFPIIVIREAGLDGFWIHRVLQSKGIESHAVDAASILTSRRCRRAKTDRVDGETLVRTLMAIQAWRAAGVFDSQGADAAGGGPPACVSRAPDAGWQVAEPKGPLASTADGKNGPGLLSPTRRTRDVGAAATSSDRMRA